MSTTTKVTVRLFTEDLEYLKAHPVENVEERRKVPYNETLRELLHGFVGELKQMRGHDDKSA